MNRSHLLIAITLLTTSPLSQSVELSDLEHIHDLEFSGKSRDTLILGTHKGLYVLDENTPVQRSKHSFDVMGLALDESNGAIYASGHPPEGGNSGLLRSNDGGVTFDHVSDGLNGPVDFHHMTISPLDNNVIYGVYESLQLSRDGGKSWENRGKTPDKLLKLSASSKTVERLYAASEQGFYLSEDAGSTWKLVINNPATAVTVKKDTIFAFIVGKGLVKSSDGSEQWTEINNSFGSQVLLDIAISGDGKRLVGLNQRGALVQSLDEGSNWDALPPKPAPATAQEKNGQNLYQTYCQSCHGIKAVGETYSMEGLTTQGYITAPALNGSMHGWHHTDEQLVKTILEGSPRTKKMPAWNQVMSENDARSIIAYLKTFWSEAQKRCQGPGHMDRNCLAGK